jgi:hypothetical protein
MGAIDVPAAGPHKRPCIRRMNREMKTVSESLSTHIRSRFSPKFKGGDYCLGFKEWMFAPMIPPRNVRGRRIQSHSAYIFWMIIVPTGK